MRSRSTLILAGLLLGSSFLVTMPAQAQNTYDQRIQQREQYEQQRIQQGIQNGSITPGEAQRLESEQSRIQGMEGRMKSDGNLSPQERARLNEKLNQANHDIYRQSHDSQVVGATPYNNGNQSRRWEENREKRHHHREKNREERNRWREKES